MEDVNKYRMVWMEAPEQRLHDWREFRLSLENLTDDEVCANIQLWWSFAPLSNISIDPYDMKTWGGAWDMIHVGDICKFSIALGMSYTAYYHNSEMSNVVMRIEDTKNDDMYMICVINDKWVLNYDTCEMVLWDDVKDTIIILEQWQCADIIKVTH